MRSVFQMNFMGAQVGLGNPVLAEQMLQNAATVQLDAPGILEGAKSTSITVTITNVGAGHDLPTGLTEVRQMWLDVTFTGPDGKVAELGKHQYGTVLKDAKGNYPSELWNAVAIQSDDRIPPKGVSVSQFKFALPEGAEWGTIKAQLLYQSAPEDLGKKVGVSNPVTVMAEQSLPVYANVAAERKANGAELSAAAASPIMPLVMSIGGLALCFGLIIFFVWWGGRTSSKGPVAPATKKEEAEGTEDSDESSDETPAHDEDTDESE